MNRRLERDVLGHKFRWLARLGYGARGMVYLIIGGLALLAAFGGGGETTDSRGALVEVMTQPFGDLLLLVLIVGLFGYASWRAVQATRDTDSHGRKPTGLAIRGGLLASAVTHALLACWGIGRLLGLSFDPTQSGGEGYLASLPGQIALGLAGVALIGVGIAHAYKGWTARFERYMRLPPGQEGWARPVCRFGLVTRGFIWSLVGYFLLDSALDARRGEASGMREALDSLHGTAFGPWLLGFTAAGLVAFGVYSVLEAIYREIDTAARTQE